MKLIAHVALSFVLGIIVYFAMTGVIFLLGVERPRHAYQRGWCDAQNARFIEGGYCITPDGRAILTPMNPEFHND